MELLLAARLVLLEGCDGLRPRADFCLTWALSISERSVALCRGTEPLGKGVWVPYIL